jgi:hypothetical protein
MPTDAFNPEPLPESQPQPALTVRLANVFAAPGEVFDALRGQPAAVPNWLIPALLAAIVGMISVWVMFSQPAILQQMEELQSQRYEQLVADGKMTQEQADQIQQRMGDFQRTIGRIAGTVGALVATFAWLFILAAVFFLMLRWGFRAPVPFMKVVEVVGLSQMIGVLGGLVTTLLMVITGSMFTNLGPTLLISDFSSDNKMHLLASSLNLFTLWWLGVLALGLARVSNRSFATVALVLY